MNNQSVPTTSNNSLAWKDKLIEYVINHAGALVSAAVIVVVGFIAARWIGRALVGSQGDGTAGANASDAHR
jgi:hypothetical protein